VIEGLPNISGVMANRLLKECGNVQKVFEAFACGDEEKLRKIKGLGPKKLQKIREVVSHNYKPIEEKNEEEQIQE
jgi:ERCC4-type nuclease